MSEESASASKFVRSGNLCTNCSIGELQFCDGDPVKTQRFSSCGACRSAFYCSRECQKEDWKRHKAECARISCTKTKKEVKHDPMRGLVGEVLAKHRQYISIMLNDTATFDVPVKAFDEFLSSSDEDSVTKLPIRKLNEMAICINSLHETIRNSHSVVEQKRGKYNCAQKSESIINPTPDGLDKEEVKNAMVKQTDALNALPTQDLADEALYKHDPDRSSVDDFVNEEIIKMKDHFTNNREFLSIRPISDLLSSDLTWWPFDWLKHMTDTDIEPLQDALRERTSKMNENMTLIINYDATDGTVHFTRIEGFFGADSGKKFDEMTRDPFLACRTNELIRKSTYTRLKQCSESDNDDDDDDDNNNNDDANPAATNPFSGGGFGASTANPFGGGSVANQFQVASMPHAAPSSSGNLAANPFAGGTAPAASDASGFSMGTANPPRRKVRVQKRK